MLIDAQNKFEAQAHKVRLKEIWSLVQELGQRMPGGQNDAEDIMRELCQAVSQQTSTKVMSSQQLAQVAKTLRARLYRLPEPPLRGEVDATITRKQERAIQWLYAQAGLDSKDRRHGFAQRIIKRAKAHTREEGTKLYQALDAVCLSRIRWEDVLSALAELRDAPLTKWERRQVQELDRKLDQGQRVTYWLVSTVNEIYKNQRQVLAVNE